MKPVVDDKAASQRDGIQDLLLYGQTVARAGWMEWRFGVERRRQNWESAGAFPSLDVSPSAPGRVSNCFLLGQS